MDDDLDQAFAIAGPQVIFEDFGDETVVANLDSGLFYSLEGSAPDIWTALIGGRTGRQIAACHGQAAQDEIAAFIAQLVAGDLLVHTELPAGTRQPNGPEPLPTYRTPTLRRFDDLQGLLLVDPIHEASPAGWPFVQGAEAPGD